MATTHNDAEQVATIAEKIRAGKTSLGIEFGSTRIKAVLIDDTYTTIASGDYGWASHLEDGLWSYSVDEIWGGLQTAYASMANDVETAYGEKLTKIGHIGFSAMMHGYLAFDEAGELLVPFRTWQNTNTSEAHKKLSELFQYNIPERWSIAHLYQAVLNKEEHVSKVAYFTTLAGYVHWKLTGKKVLGVGDASSMFPIDPTTHTYETAFIEQFDALPEVAAQPWKLENLLPEPLVAGTPAGELTAEGAKLLDPSGTLQPGIVLAPPEGDAGTGMVATNSVRVRTGNVSAGTSIFAMVVLERKLKALHPEVDLVTTPAGDLAGMSHANNFTSDLNAWVGLFGQFAAALGSPVDAGTLYGTLFRAAIADGAKPSDLNRPGHVFPLRAQPGGVLTRGGHTEATIDLVTLAGFKPAGVLCELTNDDGTMARAPECIKFAQQHNMAVVTIEDLVAYRREHERKAS